MWPGEPGDPLRLLVVDDEPDVQTLFELRFRRELRNGSLELQFASSAAQALEVVESHPDIEVVVTDLNMPGMNGLELIGRLQALPRRMKTIVLTAYDDMLNIRQAMVHGASDFLVKPLDLEDLRATLSKACAAVRELRDGDAAREQAAALDQRIRHLREVFGRYVHEDVVEHLLHSPELPGLRGERRTMTVLMADIRGFTALAERLPPEDVVMLLNSYLEVASEHVLRHRGTINEILGDGLLAFFGAPVDDPDAPRRAVTAAVELQLAMAQRNREHRRHGLPELAVAIAIHCGEAIVGTVGSEQRMKYAAVGPTLNVVGRIESQARGGQVLISDATFQRVRDVVTVSDPIKVRAKGVAEPLLLRSVRGITAPVAMVLPDDTGPLVPTATEPAVEVARVVDNRIGDGSPGRLLATGPAAARLGTPLLLATGDDVVVRLDGIPIHGHVTDHGVGPGGVCEVTVRLADVTDEARSCLARYAAN